MTKVRFSVVLIAVLLLLFPSGKSVLSVQESDPCDADILKLAVNEPSGYKSRGDRCEGLYHRQVSTSTPLSLRSFMSDPPKAGAMPSSLKVSWLLSSDRQVELHAKALKARVYFQMNARAKSNDRVFDWPTDLLNAASLGLTDIGLTASYRDKGENVYVPTRIANTQSAGDGATYRVALWPEQPLKEVFTSVTGRKADGTLVQVQPKKELGRGFYPASRAIQFSIPIPQSSGRHELTISASFAATGGVSLIIPFETGR